MLSFIHRVELAEKAILFLLIIGSVLLSLAGVFFRYVLNDSLAFVEEVAGYMLLTVVILGSSLAIRSRDHIRVELLPQLAPAWRRPLNVLAWITVFAVSVVMCWLSARFALRLIADGRTSYSLIWLKVGYPLLCLPVGYALCSLKGLLVLVDEVLDLKRYVARSVSEEELRDIKEATP